MSDPTLGPTAWDVELAERRGALKAELWRWHERLRDVQKRIRDLDESLARTESQIAIQTKIVRDHIDYPEWFTPEVLATYDVSYRGRGST